MTPKNLFFFWFLALSFYFCQGPTAFGTTEKNSPSPLLHGRWRSDCLNGKSAEIHIEKQRSVLREIFHREKSCGTPLFSIVTIGQLDFPGPSDSTTEDTLDPTLVDPILLDPIPIGPIPVDYTYRMVLLTPLSRSMAEYFSKTQLCEIATWEARHTQLITGHQCRWVEGTKPVTTPSEGQVLYGIVSLIEPFIYFGQNTTIEDSSSPLRRPRHLQQQPFGRRIQ